VTNSITLDGTEYMIVERNGFNQRVPVNSVADYSSPARTTAAAATATALAAKVALAALDTGGGVAAWQNPEAGAIAIIRCLLDVTTPATGAATVDVGVTTVGATTLDDTLIDGADVHTAAALFDNVANAGTNGLGLARLAAGKWVTASKASGACAGLAGALYVVYIRL
jgi:hypothetical protein